jgi:hypothetical protein
LLTMADTITTPKAPSAVGPQPVKNHKLHSNKL